ncbi:ABC transporter permease subunit/CPBP intramembrane protease [Rhodopirellula bahusiensis]|uniref:CPBP family intramembrane metalloprotease domain-containing protein n=1 Tax=Rhodopirellula bahusiensis TaxID=2014065 RepID=A0A2G1W6A0_9BACT|nr:ABC transporter permease subunit/CPBP intramembrane protease [Rhodopirellula bahusiensis]PHQ34548.1 CPBP family intramembrane metalloprotease domain-containing protein [Rhodopirellula bahusiensis]
MKLSWSRLGRLTQKELRETLRDRRTMLTLVMMPLLVYPLLSMALNRFLLSSGMPAEQAFMVGVSSPAERDFLQTLIDDPRSAPPEPILKVNGGQLARFEVVVPEEISPEEALSRNLLDIAVQFQQGPSSIQSVEIVSYNNDQGSSTAQRILTERLQWLQLSETMRIAQQIDPNYKPIDLRIRSIGEKASGSILGTVIPLVLVLMTITGAVYPAIDLTAGERERGTMEALMASPVPRWWVLLAKYLAVVFVAFLTAMANLLAMFVTIKVTGLASMLAGDSSIGLLQITQILGLLLLFSCFFSALLLSLTSFAKSFKEAQAYLIPVMLLSLGPAMLSLMPGVNLEGPLAVAPLLNIVLLARDILSGTATAAGAVVAVTSTLFYAAATLGIAAKLFGSDAVERTSQKSFGSLFQRPNAITNHPSMSQAGLVIALLLPASFLISNGLMQWLRMVSGTISVSSQLLLNALSLILVFGLTPLFATIIGKHRFLTTYRFSTPPLASLLGAVVLAGGAWAFAHEALALADQFGIALLSDDQIERTRSLLDKWKTVPPWILLLTMAATPAIIEELCFRGYLFSAFSNVLRPWQTVCITAVLFGLFHVFVGSTLLVERFLPTTLLGLLLGWVAFRTGSVWPGVVLHFFHNGMLELAARYHEQLDFLGLSDAEGSKHLPPTWLAAAAILVIVGISIIAWSTRGNAIEEPA